MTESKSTGEAFIVRMRIPAYIVFGIATPLPVLESLANLWPYHFGLAQWRFGALGTLSNMLAPSMIGLFLLAIVAGLASDRIVLWFLAAVGVTAGVVASCSSIMFVLDAIQTRANINPKALNRFDFATALALTRLLFVAAAGIIISVQVFRHLRAVAKSRAGSRSPLLVNQAARATATR